ncbi:hypothetical protein RhiirA4_457941 [Rhizophagus irregularis]|uniref:Mid2 domain-containing protein n=1 Tax=Rhizophagus irregularis TaxID=588596 RepID=A0A2I1GB45_9GLOM|nr:hypothetical protein RhiirA4_457941 [Rhizophagus irregularis]
MDIRNFTWINSLDLDQTADNKTSSPPSQSSNNDKTKLILASVLGVLGGALVLVGGFFAYRWINKRKKEKEVPGFFGSNFDRYDAGFPGTPVDNSKSPTEACKK